METMKSLGKQKQTLIAKHICDLFERTFNKLLSKIYMYVLYMRIYLCDGLLKPLSKRPAPLEQPGQLHRTPTLGPQSTKMLCANNLIKKPQKPIEGPMR